MPRYNLLSVGADAKTGKGIAHGVITGVLYLAPHTVAGPNLCPASAIAGCRAACLYSAGRGRFTNVQAARVKRTRWYHEDRASFIDALAADVDTLTRYATRHGLTPAVRLNGTSDILWERVAPALLAHANDNGALVYDYTKIHNRRVPSWYRLTWSWSGANPRYANRWRDALAAGHNIAVVMDTPRHATLPAAWNGVTVIDGDAHDIRPRDPSGVIVGLRAKGAARGDTSGFVYRTGGTL